MVLHPEFKLSTRQFWRQMEMFHVFIQHPELGVDVAYDSDPIEHILLRADHCAVQTPERPMITFRATVIDTLSAGAVELLLGRFSFDADDQSYIATLGF